jgi:hypothetical protein
MIKSYRLKFDKLLHETLNAYLLKVNNEEFWVPKKLCRKFILNKKLGGNVSIPSFFYEKIFSINEENADCIIIKHKPERIEPIKQTPDASLTR